jgi:hypothetical protein
MIQLLWLLLLTAACGGVDAIRWVQRYDDIDGVATLDYNGRAVAMSHDGSIVAVAAAHYDGPAGTDTGHVRVFRDTDLGRSLLGSVLLGEVAGDYFVTFNAYPPPALRRQL